jgi:hypothetical protein
MVTNMCRGLQFARSSAVPEPLGILFRFSYIGAPALLAVKVLLFVCRLCSRRRQGRMNYNVEAGFGRKSYRVPQGALMIAFAVAWGLLTILIVLQDHAIDAQRDLIQLLMQDLHTALVTSVSHGNPAPVVVRSVQLPDNQVQTKSAPSAQVHSKAQPKAKESSRVPSSQGKDASPGRSSRQAKEKVPVRPPAEYTDPSDMRRVRFSI